VLDTEGIYGVGTKLTVPAQELYKTLSTGAFSAPQFGLFADLRVAVCVHSVCEPR